MFLEVQVECRVWGKKVTGKELLREVRGGRERRGREARRGEDRRERRESMRLGWA